MGSEHREHCRFGDTCFNFYFTLFSSYCPLASTQHHGHDGSGRRGAMEAGLAVSGHFNTHRRTQGQYLGSKVYPEPAVTVPFISLSFNYLAPVVGVIQGIRAAKAQSSVL